MTLRADKPTATNKSVNSFDGTHHYAPTQLITHLPSLHDELMPSSGHQLRS